MHIYIAGPYRAKNGRTVADNIESAACVAAEVFAAGHVAITPHLNTAHFEDRDTGLTDDDWLRVTLEMLKRCDAILMIPHWQESSGAIAERAYALGEGMSVWYFDESCLPEEIAPGITEIPNPRKHVGIPPVHLTEERCPVQVDAYMRAIMRGYRTHLDKNASYSPANVLGTGEIGVVVRLWDKIARLLNLYGFNVQIASPATLSPPREPKYESIDDTYLDAHVYALIGKLVREGSWGR